MFTRSIQRSHVVTALVMLILISLAGITTYYIRHHANEALLNEANGTLFNVGPEADYVDMQGNSVDLVDYRGSVLVVNTWASWSPYAVEELPLLEQMAQEFKDKGVIILAINRKENREQADRFLGTLPTLSALKIIVDTTDFYYGATGGYAMPETLVYNQAGTIVSHIRGTLEAAELRAILTTLTETEG